MFRRCLTATIQPPLSLSRSWEAYVIRYSMSRATQSPRDAVILLNRASLLVLRPFCAGFKALSLTSSAAVTVVATASGYMSPYIGTRSFASSYPTGSVRDESRFAAILNSTTPKSECPIIICAHETHVVLSNFIRPIRSPCVYM